METIDLEFIANDLPKILSSIVKAPIGFGKLCCLSEIPRR